MRLLLPSPEISTASRRAGGVATSVTLHALILAFVVLFAAAGSQAITETGAAAVDITVVEARPEPPASRGDTELPEEELALKDPDTGAPADADGATFDIEKIRAHQDSLFPFLTVGLSFLDRIDAAVVAAHSRLGNPFDVGQAGARRPLELSAAALQQVIDDAFSRRHRWDSFDEIRTLIDTYDSNRGQLPNVIRGYLDQNLLQPFCDGARRDPRFWAMLENASDHMAFIEMVRKYVWEHPISRTTTELLFLLDELTQASRSSMLMLVETRPDRDLQFTQAETTDGFELATQVQRDYLDWLARHELVSAVEIKTRFDQVRLNILMTIVESTPDGYRAGDARYLAGEVFVDLGNFAEAVAQWKAITPDPADSYFKTYSRVLSALSGDPPSGREFGRMLESEYGKWRMAALDRLRAFNTRCDRY